MDATDCHLLTENVSVVQKDLIGVLHSRKTYIPAEIFQTILSPLHCNRMWMIYHNLGKTHKNNNKGCTAICHTYTRRVVFPVLWSQFCFLPLCFQTDFFLFSLHQKCINYVSFINVRLAIEPQSWLKQRRKCSQNLFFGT